MKVTINKLKTFGDALFIIIGKTKTHKYKTTYLPAEYFLLEYFLPYYVFQPNNSHDKHIEGLDDNGY